MSQRRAAVALVSVSSVENVFDATTKSVVAGSSPASVATRSAGIDVGNEPARDARVGVVAQRVVDHHRPEVRAPDADVDHGGDPFARRAGPLTTAQPVGELAHPVQHFVHVGDDVLAVDAQLDTAWLPQCGVQDRAVLGGVDVHAGKHRVAVFLEAGRLREIDQQFHRFPRDPVLAVVDVEVADRQRQFGAPTGVLVEELADVFIPDLVVMPLQGLPC